MSSALPPDRGRDREDDDDRDRELKRVRTDGDSDEASADSSSDAAMSDIDWVDGAAAAEEPVPDLEAWVSECYRQGFTPQQILEAVVAHYGQEVANTNPALHNTRMLVPLEASVPYEEAAAPAPAPAPAPSPGDPHADDAVQFAPTEYEDWQEWAAVEGTTVFANTVAEPYATFDMLEVVPDANCALCQEQLSDLVMQSRNCPHCFHRHCIDDMIYAGAVWQCPVCRASWS